MVTDEQRANLLKLAEYLERPELRARFSMKQFSDEVFNDKKTNCGTVGCAVGHGPFAGIRKRKTEDWFEYSDRQLIDSESDEWQWCFSSAWMATDDSPRGAAARIRRLLSHGLPRTWRGQMSRRVPLCYRP